MTTGGLGVDAMGWGKFGDGDATRINFNCNWPSYLNKTERDFLDYGKFTDHRGEANVFGQIANGFWFKLNIYVELKRN